MAAAVIMDFGFVLPVLYFLNRALHEVSASQISSKSINIWPNYYDFCKIKMAAAAILDFEFVLPILYLLHRALREVSVP